MYVYTYLSLYLRREEAILAILFTGLPITTTFADEWYIESLISMIISNVLQPMDRQFICAKADYIIIMSCDNHSLCANNTGKH